MGIFGILAYGKSVLKGREADGKDKPSLLNYFFLRPALRLEVERSGAIVTGDIINQAALTRTENELPQGDLKISDRSHPYHKCPLREPVNSVENSCSICFRA